MSLIYAFDPKASMEIMFILKVPHVETKMYHHQSQSVQIERYISYRCLPWYCERETILSYNITFILR
jgi:hypothetical protein